MTETPAPKTTRNWTPERREAASHRAKLARPWLHSTGPRTTGGKYISSLNSYKHGYYSLENRMIRWYIRFGALRLKHIGALASKQALKHREWKKSRNELITPYRKNGTQKAGAIFYKQNWAELAPTYQTICRKIS